MSRGATLTREERRVDRVLRLGYYAIEFGPWHVRFQDAVDFWPTSERWFDRHGYKFEAKGRGTDSLIAYLIEHYPLDEWLRDQSSA